MARKIYDSIKKITVRGFKSIYNEQSIELRPLTLLAGANSSGKSSIMQPVLLLKQTVEAPSDPGALLLDGPNVRFTKSGQLLSQISGQETVEDFSVGLELKNGYSINLLFKKEKGIGFDINEMNYFDHRKTIHLIPDMSSNEIERIIPKPLQQLELFEKNDNVSWKVGRERCFLTFTLHNESRKKSINIFTHSILSPGYTFIPPLQKIIHLPGLRGNPSRTYQKSAAGPEFPGTFNNYVASIITEWQSKKSDKITELGCALEDMGLTWKVKAVPIDDTQVELRVGRLTHGRRGSAHDLVSIADVGFGVSQSLPVLVALIVAEPGQVVYLEQPEIHLHPRAQRRLAHVLKKAVDRNVIVVVETHSALLLKEIQTLVAKGEISTDDVILHWLQRQEDGRTTVTSADLDEDGAYGQWPEDFDEVELESEREYLDAIETKRL